MEQFANNASTTLNGTITSGSATLVVTVATAFPSSPNFRILVDSEIMLVTAVAGTTFTISRAQENTAAAAHTTGTAVTHIFTAGAIAQTIQDHVGIGTYASRPATASAGSRYVSTDGHIEFIFDGSNWRPLIDGVVGTQSPLAASFSTHINWGAGTTLTDAQGTVFFSDTTSGGNENDHSAVLNTAGSTYTLIAGFRPLTTLAVNSGGGLVITDGTKLIKWWVVYTASGLTSQVVTLTNSTTFVANLLTVSMPVSANHTIWFKIVNNGTNRLYSWSADGNNWNLAFSHATGTFLTETQYGIVISPLNSGGCAMTLDSWFTSSP